jgi:hypothetical protein
MLWASSSLWSTLLATSKETPFLSASIAGGKRRRHWPIYGALYIAMLKIFDRPYAAAAGISWIRDRSERGHQGCDVMGHNLPPAPFREHRKSV